MPRLFIAIKISPSKSFKSKLSDIKERLKQSTIKWVDSMNFHITLKFLGDVEEYYINSMIALLDQIAERNSGFALESSGFGFFGKTRQPRVIWYGFKSNAYLDKLQHSIEVSLTELGFEKEEKNYTPHLTIGRIKSLFPEDNLKEVLSVPGAISEYYPVAKFSLIKSTLKAEGPSYQVLKDFKLKSEI